MSTVEQVPGVDDEDRRLLREILKFYESGDALPEVTPFRAQYTDDRDRLDALEGAGLLESIDNRYYLTLRGLQACNSEEARTAYERCVELLLQLREAYLAAPNKTWTPEELGNRVGRSRQEVSRLVVLLQELPGLTPRRHPGTGFTVNFLIEETIFDASLPDWQEAPAGDENVDAGPGESWIERVEISGYRPFSAFSADLGHLTVIIGANASGKSSLFDALHMLAFAADRPLPPEIDPRNNALSTLFHVGGPERIDLAVTVASERGEPLRYEVSIQGPVGAVRIARERLVEARPPSEGERPPAPILDFNRGGGTLRAHRDDTSPKRWQAPPNELALRSARSPTLVTASAFQRFVESWRFYPGFDVSPGVAMRRPAPIDENPILTEDGSNLTAVLSSLVLEHPDAWEDLNMYLRAVLPTFESLGVRPRGGRGMAIGVFRERDVKEELSLADLSDGTLRLLCWFALAVSPNLPPVICIDEPEMGLHPRVLPVLAGAFKLAAARSQLLIATHSPHFLSQFKLDDIAVMRKEEGRAVFLRPATVNMLRREVEEIGGEAIARFFLSEELEVLP